MAYLIHLQRHILTSRLQRTLIGESQTNNSTVIHGCGGFDFAQDGLEGQPKKFIIKFIS